MKPLGEIFSSKSLDEAIERLDWELRGGPIDAVGLLGLTGISTATLTFVFGATLANHILSYEPTEGLNETSLIAHSVIDDYGQICGGSVRGGCIDAPFDQEEALQRVAERSPALHDAFVNDEPLPEGISKAEASRTFEEALLEFKEEVHPGSEWVTPRW